MEGRDGGDGKVSPFGNHAGATGSGAYGGTVDLTKAGSLPKSGTTHDFTKAGSIGGSGGVKDMTKPEHAEQKTDDGGEAGLCPASVPSGGKITHREPLPGSPDVGTTPGDGARKPFRLK